MRLVRSIPAYTVKVRANFPGCDPAIRGVLHLYDLETGGLLAVMDSGHLTAERTGVAGATHSRHRGGKTAGMGDRW